MHRGALLITYLNTVERSFGMVLPYKILNILPYVDNSHRKMILFLRRAPLCIPDCFIRLASCFSLGPSRDTARRVGKTQRGSITVEAAFAMPLFFFAVLALCYMSEVMAIRTSIRGGLQYAGKIAAENAYERPVLLAGSIEEELINAVGAERLDRSIVESGSGGVHCEKSYMSMSTGIMELRASYHVYLPLPVFGSVVVPMEESCRVKGWTGYENAGVLAEDEETVYITETGMVYHRDYHCHYLELSARMIPEEMVGDLRNKSQGKYYPCERCVHKGTDTGSGVYITDYGDRYHSSLNCGGLKRTVYAIPLSEAVGKGACSKCG